MSSECSSLHHCIAVAPEDRIMVPTRHHLTSGWKSVLQDSACRVQLCGCDMECHALSVGHIDSGPRACASAFVAHWRLPGSAVSILAVLATPKREHSHMPVKRLKVLISGFSAWRRPLL